MSEQHATQDHPLHALSEQPANGRSLVDRIRQRHERRDPHLDLPIPRWDGDVVVRFGRFPVKAIQRAAKGRKAPAASNAELLVAACLEVFVRDDQTGDLMPARMADSHPAPIKFDGRLADLFEIKADTPRDIVLRMYADDVAVGAHAKKVYDWQTGADLDELTDEEADELVGEAPAAT